MECPGDTSPKKLLFIRNTLAGNTKNLCYKNLDKAQLSCLKDKYSAIVILDGVEYKQQTSDPKFDITDPELDLPVVTISFQDQEKSITLFNSTLSEKSGAVVTESIDKILEAKEMFNYPCDRNECLRFEVLCFKNALFIIQTEDIVYI